MMLPGIDVSAYQGVIDWGKVRDSGALFAAMKATEGTYYQDKQFPRNWDRSKLRSVRRIAYHFFAADESGIEQADYFHSYIRSAGGLKPGDCAMVDVEVTHGQDSRTLVYGLEAFIDRFLTTTQCGLYVYTSAWFWDGALGSPVSELAAKCPLWAAAYGGYPPAVSNWKSGYSMWQWTDSLAVPGIVGHTDGDRFLGTVQQYDLLAASGGRQ